MLKSPPLFLAVVVLVTGCSENKQVTVSKDTSLEDTSPSTDTKVESICTPGAVKECTVEGNAAVVCNEEGSDWNVAPCRDDRGNATQCIEGACLPCFPLDKRCRDDDTVEICMEDGSEWTEAQACNGELTGQVCDLGACIKLCDVNLKWNSYMGCEYWAVDLDNGFVPGPNGAVLDAAGAQYAVIVSNPSDKYPVEVEIHDSTGPITHDSAGVPFPTSRILPRQLRVYKMPRRDVNGTLLAPLAYRIRTSVPAIVYQFNPLEDEEVYSNDASLLLPTHVLDRWYYVMTRMQGFQGIRAYLTVIAIRPDTEVTVTVSGRTLAGEGIPSLNPGESITRTLQPFEVLNIETDEVGSDLTGSVVLANRNVAVFGGSEGANVPNTNTCDPGTGRCTYDGETPCETHSDCSEFITCCADHIEQAIFPVTRWGTHYTAARTMPRGNEGEVWRVLAADDNTQVSTLPAVANIPVLHAGEWFEFETKGDFELEASRPVLLGQFMTAEHAPEPGLQSGDAGIGDPAFMLVPPNEQFRNDYVVLNPPEYDEDFINVVRPLGTEVLLDGAAIPEEAFEPVGSGMYWVARLPVPDGVHVLTGESPFGVLVYGFDQYVSYGYPGGLNLVDLDLIDPPEFAPAAP